MRPEGTRALCRGPSRWSWASAGRTARDGEGDDRSASRATWWSTTSAPLAGNPAACVRARGRQPVAARQGQRHLPARRRYFVTADELDPAAGLGASKAGASLRPDTAGCASCPDRSTGRHAVGGAGARSLSSRGTSRSSPATWMPRQVRRLACGVVSAPPTGDRRSTTEGVGVVENPIIDWTEDPRRPLSGWPARSGRREPAVLALVEDRPQSRVSRCAADPCARRASATDLHIEAWDPWAAKRSTPRS